MKIDKEPAALHSGRGKRFAVAVSEFNAPVTERLLDSCMAVFRKAGVRETDLHVIRVPGAFELPLACLALARTGRYAAVVALGCVIRGETPHDRYISHAVARGLMRVGLDTGTPVIFGVLTPLNERQARARAGGAHGDKGRDAALAALKMARALRGIK
jgi:6,7-dimethyl-8-ribityllumazine synthase